MTCLFLEAHCRTLITVKSGHKTRQSHHHEKNKIHAHLCYQSLLLNQLHMFE